MLKKLTLVVAGVVLLGPFLVFTEGPPAEPMKALGLGRAAAEHGPNCPELRAAENMSSDVYVVKALTPIVDRATLTTHEQMHLVDVVLDHISSDHHRQTILLRLAKNPALTPEGLSYLRESLAAMNTDHYRTIVLDALRDRSPSEQK